MQRLKNYEYNEGLPLSKPYDQKQTYNAYYKGIQKQTGKQVLISQYRQIVQKVQSDNQEQYQKYCQKLQKQQRNILTRFKKLQKLKTIQHQNLSKIYDVIQDKRQRKLFLILQWCEAGDLLQYKQKQITFDYKTALYIVKQISKALKVIHDAQLIHRFINLQNIQFNGKGIPKLTYKCLYYKSYYLSPDQKQGKRKKQNDIFSLGIVLHRLIYFQTPFKGNSINQYKLSVKQGVKYPKKGQQMFPKISPTQLKYMINSMTAFNSQDRITCQDIINQSQNILQYQNQSLYLSKTLRKNIIKQKYIPFKIIYDSNQQTLLIGLNIQKKQLVKINIYKGKNKDLKKYIQQILLKFIKVQQVLGIMPIYKHKIIQHQYLMIVSFYDNQGSINDYFESGGSMSLSNTKKFIQNLTIRLKKFNKTHNHLTYDNIVIRNCNFYIKYPPFQTNEYRQKLQKNKNNIIMIAPQVIEGKISDKSDSWSIAMFKYRLQNQGQMPKFDKFNRIVIANKKNISKQDIKYYQDYLVKDPQKRKNITKQDQLQLFKQFKQQSSPVPPVKVTLTKIKLQKQTLLSKIYHQLQIFLYLQNHWTKPIRVLIKCIISLILYIFLFYFNMFLINGQLLTQHSIFQATTMQIRAFQTDNTPNINYTLVTKTPQLTNQTFYNQTLYLLRDDYQCVLNDYSAQSDIQNIINRTSFTTYQVFGILLSIINLLVICVALSKMDFPKIYFISPIQQGNYNSLFSWIFINLAIASQTSFIYLIYGSLFHISLQPCISKPTLFALQYLFKDWVFSFNIRFIWIYIGLVISYAIVIYFILRPNKDLHIGFKIGVGCRAMGGTGGDISSQKQSVFGKCGQLLLLITGIIYLLLDFIFSCFINKYKTAQQQQGIQERKKKKKGQVQDSMSQLNQTQEPIA